MDSTDLVARVSALQKRTPAQSQSFALLEAHLRAWFLAEGSRAVTALEIFLGPANLRLLYDITGGEESEILDKCYPRPQHTDLAELASPLGKDTATPPTAAKSGTSDKQLNASRSRQEAAPKRKAVRSTSSGGRKKVQKGSAEREREKVVVAGVAMTSLALARPLRSSSGANAEPPARASRSTTNPTTANGPATAALVATAASDIDLSSVEEPLRVALFLEKLKEMLLPPPSSSQVRLSGVSSLRTWSSSMVDSGVPTIEEIYAMPAELLQARMRERHRHLQLAQADVIYNAFLMGRLLEVYFRRFYLAGQNVSHRLTWDVFLKTNGLPCVRYALKLRKLSICLESYPRLCFVSASLGSLLPRVAEIQSYLQQPESAQEAAFWRSPV
jgi:hypothetical protein